VRVTTLRAGDVTVQEFADVWNNPETGLMLMVPVLMKDDESGNMVNVQVQADMKVADALDLWWGLYKSNQFHPQLESAWFLPVNLSSDFLVSKCAFKWVNLYRYTVADRGQLPAVVGLYKLKSSCDT
jgi:hypothetical protein